MLQENVEAYDTEPRRNFTSADITQMFLTAVCLGSSGYLLNFCQGIKWSYWHYFMFFGNLIWLVFLFLTSIIQFRNRRTRRLVNSVDWVYLIFHTAMFVWANIMFWDENSPVEAENFWVLTYLIMGYIALAIVLCTLFMTVLRIMNRKRLEKENPQKLELNNPEMYEVQDDLE
jgi:carbon starvation protein CstA